MNSFSRSLLGASFLALGALAGCKSDTAAADNGNQLTFNDFESLEGWASNTESLSKEQAHSGSYSVSVGPQTEFGLGYAMRLDKILDHKPHKLRISGWGYMTDDKSTAQLGLQLFDLAQGKQLFGEGIDYATAVKTPGKWVEISKEITLPPTVTGDQQVRLFLYRASASTPAYVDDLRLSEVKE